MSRSLSRIRNLVSEIEEIHRQGQQGRKSASTPSLNPAPAPEPVSVPTPPLVEEYIPEASPVLELKTKPEPVDPFEALSEVVSLEEHRTDVPEVAVSEAKIFMQLNGAVALSLQIADTGEIVELKQVGDLLEIRFKYGNAFHIPLKAVA